MAFIEDQETVVSGQKSTVQIYRMRCFTPSVVTITLGSSEGRFVEPFTGAMKEIFQSGNPILDFTISSSSDNDTSAGTGLQTCRIHYIDTNDELSSTDITMNGTTNVSMPADVKKVLYLEPLALGSNKRAEGNIRFRSTFGATVFTWSGGWQDYAAASFVVPAGKTASVKRIRVGVDPVANILVTVSRAVSGGAGDAVGEWQTLLRSTSSQDVAPEDVLLAAGEALVARYYSNAESNTPVTVEVDLELWDE